MLGLTSTEDTRSTTTTDVPRNDAGASANLTAPREQRVDDERERKGGGGADEARPYRFRLSPPVSIVQISVD